MHQLSEILDEKGHDVLQIEADASVFQAVERMVEANVGSLLVTNRGDVIGIVTERDYLRRVTLEGRRRAGHHCPRDHLFTAGRRHAETTVDECMAMMTERRIRHIPVFEDGDLVGMISIGDLVKFASRQQSYEIKYLTDYITAH